MCGPGRYRARTPFHIQVLWCQPGATPGAESAKILKRQEVHAQIGNLNGELYECKSKTYNQKRFRPKYIVGGFWEDPEASRNFPEPFWMVNISQSMCLREHVLLVGQFWLDGEWWSRACANGNAGTTRAQSTERTALVSAFAYVSSGFEGCATCGWIKKIITHKMLYIYIHTYMLYISESLTICDSVLVTCTRISAFLRV